MLSKSSWATFKTIFETLSALGVCHVTMIGGAVYKKYTIFEVFGAYLRESFIFFLEIFFRSKILPISCDKHQKLDYGCSTYAGNESKSPDFGRFWRFVAFFELFVLPETFHTDYIIRYMISRVVRFFHNIKLWANNQYNADQIFVKSALWSGPYKVLLSVLLIRETWNLDSV